MSSSKPRNGKILPVLNDEVSFSFWPKKVTTKRGKLNTRVFVSDPWPSIRRSIEASSISDTSKHEALAYCEQSEDFFRSSEVARLTAAKPLLLYYAFMNLAKAYILAKGKCTELPKAMHGLQRVGGVTTSFTAEKIQIVKNPPNGGISVFDTFQIALCNQSCPSNELTLDALIPQIIIGHRLWVDGQEEFTSMPHDERFITLEKHDFMVDDRTNELWVRTGVTKVSLERCHYGLNEFVQLAGRGKWRSAIGKDAKHHYFESIVGKTHNLSPLDTLPQLTAEIQHDMWATIRRDEPYRKYYFYACPDNEVKQLLPQPLSIYALMYYFGSITRYVPAFFDDIMSGPFAPFVESFINDQPKQFLYLMASQFLERDVTKAAII